MTQRLGKSNGTDVREEHVIDFNRVREQRLEEKRRNTERIFFKNLLSVYSITGQAKMRPIQLIEVSEEGCSFQILHDPENPWPKSSEEVPLRLYFSQDTYLEIIVKIRNALDSFENGVRYVRFGCSVDSQLKSYPAYQQFVRFLKLYSEHAHKDMGDVSLFYL